MNTSKLNNRFLKKASVGIIIAVWIVFLDIFSLLVTSSSRVEEIFLVRSGPLLASGFNYLLILLIPFGIITGAFFFLLNKYILRWSILENRWIQMLIVGGALVILVLGLRFILKGGIDDFTYYSFMLLFFFLISFLALLLIFNVKSKIRFFSSSVQRNRSIFISIGATVVFFLIFIPFLLDLYLQKRFRYGKKDTENPNIILIVMDTVKADVLSCYENHDLITPNLDEIAGEGVLFSNALSPAPWTLPSHASLFTGLYPSQHKADHGLGYLDESFLTLAEVLSKLRYKTVGLTENPFVGSRLGFSQGFKDFYEIYGIMANAMTPRIINKLKKSFGNDYSSYDYADDSIYQLKRWIYKNHNGSNSKPFFAFINMMAAHLPNYPREKYIFCNPTDAELKKIEPVNKIPERFYLPQFRLNDEDLDIMQALYEGEIAYLDNKLGGLFEFLKRTKILDDTILIITSDHGENFGEHGLVEHQFCLYNSLLHVPLIIRYPEKIEAGSVHHGMVSTIYLFRTIIDLIGYSGEVTIDHIEPSTLFNSPPDAVLFAEYANPIGMLKGVLRDEAPEGFDYSFFDRDLKCIMNSELKYIWASDGQYDLYDIKNDWHEEHNLVDLETNAAEDLQKKLEKWQASLWRPNILKRKIKLDKRTEEELKALGYIK